MPWAEVVVKFVDCHAVELCMRAYPGHPQGCPNVANKPGCPSVLYAPPLLLDVSKRVYAIWNAFDLAGHIARMRALHTRWTERQLVCCRYWQGGARKALRAEVRNWIQAGYPDRMLNEGGGFGIAGTPEACGVDVSATMLTAGIKLEWPPRIVAYQVVLAGIINRGG